MKQYCIAIIGAGQIGSRHLQALCHLKGLTRVDLVDPSNKSLHMAQNLYQESIKFSKQNTELFCHNNMDDLPEKLDLVIISTNSDVREAIIRNVVRKRSVGNLVLEKILFQRKVEYIEIESFLKTFLIPTWVNCWMRTTDLFKKIKLSLNLKDPIHIKVEGSQWRMGSSSIHFMDLFAYFTECNDIKFTDIQLNSILTDSKRREFKEFLGKMTGQNSRGDTLSLSCSGTEDAPPTVAILNGPNKYKITRLNGDVGFESSNDLSNRIGKANLPYQSQLTHIWVKHILENGSCDLPTYNESIAPHLELLRVFTEHLKKITGKEYAACPIT